MKTHFRRNFFVSLSLGAAIVGASACSSSTAPGAPGSSGTPSTGVVQGNVKSTPLSVQSAIAHYGVIATHDVNGVVTNERGLVILIADKGNTCDARHAQGSTNLELAVAGNPIAAGTHAVYDPLQEGPEPSDRIVADFYTADATCASPVAESGKQGTVTISSIDASHVSGTFDITFADGHVTGSFDAIICSDGASTARDVCPP